MQERRALSFPDCFENATRPRKTQGAKLQEQKPAVFFRPLFPTLISRRKSTFFRIRYIFHARQRQTFKHPSLWLRLLRPVAIIAMLEGVRLDKGPLQREPRHLQLLMRQSNSIHLRKGHLHTSNAVSIETRAIIKLSLSPFCRLFRTRFSKERITLRLLVNLREEWCVVYFYILRLDKAFIKSCTYI